MISNRHGKGALPGEYPLGGEPFSVFAAVDDTADAEGCCRWPRRRAVGRVPARARSSGSWASPWRATSGRTRSRPGRTAATSTSTCSRSGRRSTCRCRCRARWRLRRRPALRAGRRRGGADRDGGVAAGDRPVRRRGRTRTPSRDFGELAGPLAETAEYLVPTGLDEDLDVGDAELRAGGDRAARRPATAWTRARATPTSAPPPTSTSRRWSTS